MSFLALEEYAEKGTNLWKRRKLLMDMKRES